MTYAQTKIKSNFNTLAHQWDHEIIPLLEDYIRIPCKSPLFDKNWQANGYMSAAMQLVKQWCEKQPIKNKKIELLHIENRTPVLVIDIPGDSDETILLYGHIDKQPEMAGWFDGFGPWIPDKKLEDTTLEEQFKSMNLDRLKKNIIFAEKTGMPRAYLWGAEWWLWLESRGARDFSDYVKELKKN